MGLFGGYQNAGPGIDPNAPKKKPFFRFWELLKRNFGKILTVNLIYTLLHIPLFLAGIIYMSTNNKFTDIMTLFVLAVQFFIEGPALAGCARVQRLIVLDKAFFLGEEFKKGFTQNFGAALLYWTIDAIVIASAVAGYFVYPQYAEATGRRGIFIIYGISLAVAAILLFMNYYIMALQAATTLKPKTILKNSFMLVGLSLKECLITTAGIAVMLGLMWLLLSINSLFMFLIPFFPAAFIGYLVMFVHYPVIQKFVINPYYEESGEENPEDDDPHDDDDDRLFTDRGGSEEPMKKESRKKGKTIS